MTQDLGSSGPGLFVVFLPFREEEKKSFRYLVFDSDDSFLFYSLAQIFINVLYGGVGGAITGSEILSLHQAPQLPSRSYPLAPLFAKH